MQVRFWGTRGSIATPGPDTIRFGGNTSCVEVTTNAGACFILDCGTGARIVQVDEMRPGGRPQAIAGVAIAVQADRATGPGALETIAHCLQRKVDHGAPGVKQIRRDPP